ncbi:MAG TPA: hypothetical protein VMD02_03780 [Candidatus Omnitrophota bacterium]|nr:hypothetical protein [Candidatus Omnitrophota bacterium]
MNKKIELAIAFLLIVFTALLFFRGAMGRGMCYDEVNRVNNIIPLLNHHAQPYDQSIFSLRFHRFKVPLMYKQYISTVFVLKFLPIGLFHDYRTGIRVLYFIYFVLFALGTYAIAARYHRGYAALFTMLAITSPFLYPDVTMNFATIDLIFLFTLAGHLLYTYFKSGDDLWYLFLAALAGAFACNLYFYNSWVIAAFLIASPFFFPEQWKTVLSSPRRIGVACAGIFIGLFNFIAYNLARGFPTVRPLFERIFNPRAYNTHPIDYKVSRPFLEDIVWKAHLIKHYLGGHLFIYLILLAALAALYFLIVRLIVRSGRWAELRGYLIPPAALLITLAFILISPNTTRREHYYRLEPFLALAFVMPLPLAKKLFPDRSFIIKAALILPLLLLALNGWTSNDQISHYEQVDKNIYFSPAIYALNDYIDQRGIDSSDIVHTQWGMFTQLYFLNRGEYRIVGDRLTYQLLGAKNDAERFGALRDFFASDRAPTGEALYFPVYAKTPKDDPFFKFIGAYGGKLSVAERFRNKNGTADVILLYRLDRAPEFIARVKRSGVAAPHS